MKPNLKFERFLRHSPERVWKALTDSKALSRWYLDNDFSPVVGHQFTFRPAPDMGFDGILCGEVIRVDAPHQLVYTFHGGSMQGNTLVTWTLIPDDDGTRLLLQHTGFNDLAGTALETMMTICPSRFLTRLADSLETILLVEV
jgi:uncharacterized protein YndB with AHSA1/START domain